MTEFYLRYVSHERVEAYKAIGWHDASGKTKLGLHGHWSLLMKWPHEGDPVEPDCASGRRNVREMNDGD